MNDFLKKLSRLGFEGERVIVCTRGIWNEVTSIPSDQNYLFAAECGIGDVVQPKIGDAVFTLCSSENWREHLPTGVHEGQKLRGQASVFVVLA